MIKREPMAHSPSSALEATAVANGSVGPNSRISFGSVSHNNSQLNSVAPCNPWLYSHHQPHHQEPMVNSLEQMTAILPTSVSSSFLDQLPNHSHGYSNSSQLIVQPSPSPDSLGDSVSIVSNMARRASATYQSTSNVIPLAPSSVSTTSSLVNSPVSHSNESLVPLPPSSSTHSTSRNHSIRSNLHHQQQQADVDCDELSHDSRHASSSSSSNPHHPSSHFIYAFQCSLCDNKDDIRNS